METFIKIINHAEKFVLDNQNEIIGKIISVKYKEATKNKDGSESLQFPVFLCIREDKDIADV